MEIDHPPSSEELGIDEISSHFKKSTMNSAAKTLYRIGSVLLMLIGVGHTMIHFARKGKDSAVGPVIQQMEAFKVDVAGMSRSLLELYEGFSLTMGTLLFFIGLQNFFLAKSLNIVYKEHSVVVIVPILIAGATFALSVRYFFLPPLVLSFFAFLVFMVSLWQLKKKSSTLTKE